MNPYEVLGVPSSASTDDIRAAYHRLAKQWHPDRFKGQERVEAEERFRLLAEAFSMVKDTARREDPAKAAAASAPGPSTQLKDASEPKADAVPPKDKTAQDWFGDAEKAFKDKDYHRALVLVQYAVRKDQERPEYHALHAQALEKSGGNSRDVVKALETAVRLNRKDIDSTIRLAEMYQTLGMQSRASRLWEAAFNLNPNHPVFKKQAQQEKKDAKAKAASASAQGLKGQWIELVEKVKQMLGR